MDLDSLKIANLEEKFETLIATQQDKIDSLSMIVHDTQIAEGYFSSILNTQLTQFSLIVSGVIALALGISWGYFTFFFKKELKSIDEKYEERTGSLETKIDKQNDELNKSIETFNNEFSFQEYNVTRTMLLTIEAHHDPSAVILWAMRLAATKHLRRTSKRVNEALSSAYNVLVRYVENDLSKEHLEEFNEKVEIIREIDKVDQKKLERINIKINKLYFDSKNGENIDRAIVELTEE